MPDKTTREIVLSLRLSPEELRRVDDVVVRYHSLHARTGFSAGVPPIMSRAAVLRFAIAEGLTVMQQKLADEESKRKKGRAR